MPLLMNCEPDSAASGRAQQVLKLFGRVRLRVYGTSMTPAILPGDFVQVEQVGFSEITIGDVILFRRGDRLFAHRVVSSPLAFNDAASAGMQRFMITRGDRHFHDDPPVNQSQVIGRVTSVEPLSGWASGWAERMRSSRSLAAILRKSGVLTFIYVRTIDWLRLLSNRRTPCQA